MDNELVPGLEDFCCLFLNNPKFKCMYKLTLYDLSFYRFNCDKLLKYLINNFNSLNNKLIQQYNELSRLEDDLAVIYINLGGPVYKTKLKNDFIEYMALQSAVNHSKPI